MLVGGATIDVIVPHVVKQVAKHDTGEAVIRLNRPVLLARACAGNASWTFWWYSVRSSDRSHRLVSRRYRKPWRMRHCYD